MWCRYRVGQGGEGTHVFWQFDEQFDDPLPHTFQLEGAAEYAPDTADTFETIGLPSTNSYYLIDPGAETRRSLGPGISYSYRVRMTTPRGEYVSYSISSPDSTSFRNWRIASDIVRRERLRFSRFTGVQGWLFKRRRTGATCPRCFDPFTRQATDPRCPTCRGTGKEGGYFAPIQSYIDIEVGVNSESTDPTSPSGMIIDQLAHNCRFMADPYPNDQDVFVAKDSDQRYVLRDIADAAIVTGYPVVCTGKALAAPLSDPIYDLEVPADDWELEQ